jgi:hypothetical protein
MKFSKVLIVLSLLIAAAWTAGCASSGSAEGTKVNYTVARNYFFLNNGVLPADGKVTTQKQFDAAFGMATVMGKNGQPTPVDFKRQFVIAVVKPETPYSTDLKPLTLTRTDGGLTFRYRCLTGTERRSYTIRPMMMIIVDRSYVKSKVNFDEQNN